MLSDAPARSCYHRSHLDGEPRPASAMRKQNQYAENSLALPTADPGTAKKVSRATTLSVSRIDGISRDLCGPRSARCSRESSSAM
jgi:hypothetical protein